MSDLTFYKVWTQLSEAPLPPPGGAGAAPPPPGGAGPDMGAPGGDLGGLGGPGGGLGGGMGGLGGPGGGMGGPGMGDPMGGPGAGGQPIPVKFISSADVWKVLDKILKDEKNTKFFEEISILNKKKSKSPVPQKNTKSSLFR